MTQAYLTVFFPTYFIRRSALCIKHNYAPFQKYIGIVKIYESDITPKILFRYYITRTGMVQEVINVWHVRRKLKTLPDYKTNVGILFRIINEFIFSVFFFMYANALPKSACDIAFSEFTT